MNEYEALALAVAAKKRKAESARNPDGTYGQPPEGMFLNPVTGQMTERTLLKGNMDVNPAEGAAAGYMQGYALNTVDEAAGLIGYLQGGEDMSNFRREQARAGFEAASEQQPAAYTGGLVAGAVTSPVTKAMPAVTTIKGGAAVAGAQGLANGFASGEGSATERLKTGAKESAVSSLFGAGSSAIFRSLNAGARALAQRNETRPTVEGLRGLKNSAYAAVRRANINFDENDTLATFQRLLRKSKTSRWDLDAISEVDKPAFDALRVLERRATAGRPLSLNTIDKTRQKLWDIYNKTDHAFALEAIGELDDMIARKAGGSEVLSAAREANSRFAKAQLLENAFRKAQLQTASTGSGGNILNKYRQAVTRIITTPREAKWFSQEELQLMENFVMGDAAENTLRRIGKLAPGGNGLMTALNVYAASVEPSMLAITGAAQTAKGMADRSAMKGADALQDAVATGIIKSPEASRSVRGLAVGSGALANERLP